MKISVFDTIYFQLERRVEATIESLNLADHELINILIHQNYNLSRRDPSATSPEPRRVFTCWRVPGLTNGGDLGEP